MLKELKPKDPGRRWFADDYFDLIVWISHNGAITGFQLCYDVRHAERALTWTREKGFLHERVDAGEENPAKNRTPILVPDGLFRHQEVRERFLAESAEIDPAVRNFVSEKLEQYPGGDAV